MYENWIRKRPEVKSDKKEKSERIKGTKIMEVIISIIVLCKDIGNTTSLINSSRLLNHFFLSGFLRVLNHFFIFPLHLGL